MHVQLINESAYNKDHKLQINTLCFYYRNHKHVLYGSFTIDDEVFVFSFNIFDIYRSYNSKSNKKPSKSSKSSSSSKKQAAAAANAAATAASANGVPTAQQASNIPLPTKPSTTLPGATLAANLTVDKAILTQIPTAALEQGKSYFDAQ